MISDSADYFKMKAQRLIKVMLIFAALAPLCVLGILSCRLPTKGSRNVAVSYCVTGLSIFAWLLYSRRLNRYAQGRVVLALRSDLLLVLGMSLLCVCYLTAWPLLVLIPWVLPAMGKSGRFLTSRFARARPGESTPASCGWSKDSSLIFTLRLP